MRYRHIALVGILTLVPITASDAGKPPANLDDFIKSQGFTSFHPPRADDGLGAIISFDNKGRETIVAQPGDCIDPKAAGMLPKPGAVAIGVTSYKITKNNTFGASITGDGVAKAIGVSELNASAGIGTDKVASIEVKLTKPYRNRLVKLTTLNLIKGKPADWTCASLLGDKKNLLIQSVLGAEGISYTFTDEGGRKINLTLKLLQALGLSADMQKKYEGKGSLDFSGDILLGYNVWSLRSMSGLQSATTTLVALTPGNVEALRNKALK